MPPTYVFSSVNPIADKLLSSRAYVLFGLTVVINHFFLTKNQPILTTLPIFSVLINKTNGHQQPF